MLASSDLVTVDAVEGAAASEVRCLLFDLTGVLERERLADLDRDSDVRLLVRVKEAGPEVRRPDFLT